MSKFKKTTLVVLLDAFRWDYLNPEDTPFLWSMKDKGVHVKKIHNPGMYCERSCFMTGATPDVTGNYFAMSMMPPGYKRASWEPIFNVPSHIRSRLCMTEDVKPDFVEDAFYNPDTDQVIESIWDVLRDEDKTFQFEACAALGIKQWKGKTTHGPRTIFIRDGLEKGHDLYYQQISETDQMAHIHGVNSEVFRGVLRHFDEEVRGTYHLANDIYEDVNLLVFGDHGMEDVEKIVDISLNLTPYNELWDYMYLKSSAAIQFWVFNSKVRDKILDDRQLNKHGRFIESPSPRQGDLIWLADNGIMVNPCHFHNRGDVQRAMHGWDPEWEPMQGTAIIVDGEHAGTVDTGSLIDICPTICDLVGIRYPEMNSGRSLIK